MGHIRDEKGVVQFFVLGVVLILAGITAFLLFTNRQLSGVTLLTNQNKSVASSSPSTSVSPSIDYYALNLVGVSDKVNSSLSSNSLYIPVKGQCVISVKENTFKITDNDCTDNVASFSLPVASPSAELSSYDVYARVIGKPKGKVDEQTCQSDPTTEDTYCFTNSTLDLQNNSANTLTDGTNALLTVYVDLTSNGDMKAYNLFDNAMQNYFWNYNKNGYKVAQLRLYPTKY